MTTTVVIRCLNEEEHIGRLLTGLSRQAVPPDQVVVVDSGSTDATLDIARRFDAEVHHIAPESFSFGRALNVGCRAATGDVLLFVSAHVYPVHTSWLQDMVAPFVDPAVALSYGRQIGNEQTRFSEHRILDRWFPPRSDPAQRHPFCNNANAAVRRSLWESWPYDEELTGLEDLAWAKNAIEHGHKVAYIASAPVVHAHRETFLQVANRYRREAIAHKAIYEDQEMPAGEAAWLALLNAGSDLAHATRERRLREAGDILSFRTAQFLGTYQGFQQAGPVRADLKRRFYYPAAVRPGARDLGTDRVIDYGATPEEGA
ncbi:MAG: glycosyltransferase [Mycobacteriales bacterium]|nr:glycosyltransferase [Mycobacteriales bacterium]